jgi:eukaryotic-like serine/threonine-protein kinase
MPLVAGDRLGPYQILAPLGAGGMGDVYRATDTRLNRRVAIKVLKGPHSDRFEQEARAIAALNHPHICTLHDVGPDYLVMEYVEGAVLSGPLAVEEALRLALQMAAALESAHAKGITHRDLKPANILVTKEGVKLLDFGLAKMIYAPMEASTTQTLGAQTMAGTILGTAAYMSPEQAEGKPADARSDIFSFGAVLYEMLSGQRAFEGESAILTMAAVLHKEPRRLDAPPALERVVMRCLEKQAARRFQNMAELREALRQVTVGPVEKQPSIAVLPFANMSADKENEYFSDGLAEEILNLLAKVPGLKVIARTSSFAFRGKEQDITKIAEALRVQNILEGSVRRSGNRIRVTAQLIAAADGTHLWSERYDRELADVFAVQDEIAGAIAAALQIQLTRDTASPGRYLPTLPAYEAFLKGRHYMQKWTPEALARGKQYYLQAIEIDPRFAQAHIELGSHYFSLATENQIPPPEAAALMRVAAQSALDIDPAMAEAHAVLALVAVLDYDWEEAGREFRTATAGKYVSPLVRYFYSGFYLRPMGRVKEAFEQVQFALNEDPLNLLLSMSPGLYLMGLEDPAGEAVLRQVLELDENAWIPMVWLATHCVRQGRKDEALAWAEKFYSLVPANASTAGLFAGILSVTGNQKRAQSLVKTLGSGEAFGTPVGLFNYHMVRGEMDVAAKWFEKVIEQRDTRAPSILPFLFGQRLVSSPYWPKLAKLMNLPEVVL